MNQERKSSRIEVHLGVGLRKSGYHKSSADLLDISPHGCRVELPERVSIGETVWITLPGLESTESRVAWTQDWIAGLQFVHPLHQAVFDALLARLKG